MCLDAEDLRKHLDRAHVMLVFTPELCAGHAPLEALEAVLDWVDLIQIRPKSPEGGGAPGDAAPRPVSAGTVSEARAAFDWTCRVLDTLSAAPGRELPVLVNDRVDVAAALAHRGCAGVHLGQEDCPIPVARELLGPRALIGSSTHSAAQVVAAMDQPLDYLGFGPIHPTQTKGYVRGLGPEAAWVADNATTLPVFAIGGITAQNVGELAPVRRVAVGSAILSASDPGAAARELRSLLLEA